jgi:hypothetical protein
MTISPVMGLVKPKLLWSIGYLSLLLSMLIGKIRGEKQRFHSREFVSIRGLNQGLLKHG